MEKSQSIVDQQQQQQQHSHVLPTQIPLRRTVDVLDRSSIKRFTRCICKNFSINSQSKGKKNESKGKFPSDSGAASARITTTTTTSSSSSPVRSCVGFTVDCSFQNVTRLGGSPQEDRIFAGMDIGADGSNNNSSNNGDCETEGKDFIADKLVVFECRFNFIKSITESFIRDSLYNVTVLNLTGNDLTGVRSGTMKKGESEEDASILSGIGVLKNLSELYLCNNFISELDPDAFAGLTQLKRIDLHANRLSLLDLRSSGPTISPFRNLPKLESIILSKNRIKEIWYTTGEEGLEGKGGHQNIVNMNVSAMDSIQNISLASNVLDHEGFIGWPVSSSPSLSSPSPSFHLNSQREVGFCMGKLFPALDRLNMSCNPVWGDAFVESILLLRAASAVEEGGNLQDRKLFQQGGYPSNLFPKLQWLDMVFVDGEGCKESARRLLKAQILESGGVVGHGKDPEDVDRELPAIKRQRLSEST
eukprot:Nk52_evm18s316 gene=Nk52_evmTU18s316